MKAQELLHQRRETLRMAVGSALETMMLHSSTFVARVLGEVTVRTLCPNVQLIDVAAASYDGRYQGYPWLAAAGFALGGTATLPDALVQEFRAGLDRLRQRTGDGQAMLAGDDIGLLGIAEGLARLADTRAPEIEAGRDWLLPLIQSNRASSAWSSRMRDLAGDLLDGRGRLQVRLDHRNGHALALELVLRALWTPLFQRVPPLDQQNRETLSTLLLIQPDTPHEPEEAAVWLRCLDIMTAEVSQTLVPSVSDTARILVNIQHGLKRWVWREKSRRQNTAPSHWQIDDEYDVQALLWTVLYPIYGSALVDERYLPNWGNVQPRVDLGITSLKLIIEVKIAREPADFAEIEEQVAGDLGLYFKDPGLFNRMIVFIYDDCNKHSPEKYESLRSALKQRERIEEVIIVRRPSMLPDRNKRN
jgi:hypothetical protein